jgi:hypothetical protein
MQADRPAIYRPRRPRASPLWQCVSRHLSELRASGRARRAVEQNVLERFLECGDLHCGFARIRCGGCGHDLLLAYSCKPTRKTLPPRAFHGTDAKEVPIIWSGTHPQYRTSG